MMEIMYVCVCVRLPEECEHELVMAKYNVHIQIKIKMIINSVDIRAEMNFAMQRGQTTRKWTRRQPLFVDIFRIHINVVTKIQSNEKENQRERERERCCGSNFRK